MQYSKGSSYQKLIYYFFGRTCFDGMSMRCKTTSTFKNNILNFSYNNHDNNASHKSIGAVERAIFYRIGFISHIIKYIKLKKDGVYVKNPKYKDFWRYIPSFLSAKKKEICRQINVFQIKNILGSV